MCIFKYFLLSLSLSLSSFYLNAELLTVERIYQAPSLEGTQQKDLKFSPDGTRITYLQAKKSKRHQYDLWQYNFISQTKQLLVDALKVHSGKESLSIEEIAHRERQRTYGHGIMQHQFSSDGKKVIFALNGIIYLYDQKFKQTTALTSSDDFVTDIKFSPNDRYISFIRQQNIFIIDINSQKETQLTSDTDTDITNGMAEFIAKEEMNRNTGYWWSPNSKHIAFTRVNQTPVVQLIRNDIYADTIKTTEQRYPQAGSKNVDIQLAHVEIKSKKISFVELSKALSGNKNGKDIYLARVKWLPDSQAISYQIQSRDQKTLWLNTYDLDSKKEKNLLIEKMTHWVNLHHDLYFLKDLSFIWASERSGFKHLYKYSAKGELLSQLTKGNWVVDEISTIDENNRWLFFTGRADTPLEKHLYKIPLNNKNPEHVVRVSTRSGFHRIEFSKNHQHYIDSFSNTETPTQISIHNVDGERLSWLEENTINDLHPLKNYVADLPQAEFGTLKADDGITDLYYKIYKPSKIIPGKKYPVVVNVYGGPKIQKVNNKWNKIGLTELLVQQGYIVFQLDNRGSSARGQAFEAAIDQQFGHVEIVDQITGVKYLHSLPYVDKKNIAIYGHSFGGYLSIMAMLKANDYFSTAIAGAPVTNWLRYDTHYTERYLGSPLENKEGYKKSSVLTYISALKKPFLLYHGMADDNVLFTHSTELMKAMQDENKLFEVMTYPGTKHSMHGQKVKTHLNRTLLDFLNRRMKNHE